MATARTARRTTKAAKPAPAVEPEEDFDEDLVEEEGDDELEEMEADEVSESKPTTKSAAQEVTFGVRDLVELIKKETGQDTDPRAIRTLIRKMARDGQGRVDREIVPGNRQRYDWSGPNDPEVRAIVAAFKGGELEAEKKAKLDALKQQKAAKTAAKKAAQAANEVEEDEEEAPAPRRRTAKKAAAKTPTRRRAAKPAPVEEVEDDEELDLDEE